MLNGPNSMEKEFDEGFVPTLAGWNDVAMYVIEQLYYVKEDLEEASKKVDGLIEAARNQDDWPSEGYKIFEGFEPDNATEEEIEAYAARIQDKWSEAKTLLSKAKELIEQAKACMDEFKNE